MYNFYLTISYWTVCFTLFFFLITGLVRKNKIPSSCLLGIKKNKKKATILYNINEQNVCIIIVFVIGNATWDNKIQLVMFVHCLFVPMN